MLEHLNLAFQEVIDACGDDRNLICEWVFEQTNSETGALLTTWFVDRPLRILFVLVLAWFVVRFLRRIVRRFVTEVGERSAGGRSGDDVAVGSLRRRVNLMSSNNDPTDRSFQRAITLGKLLESLVSILVWTTAIFVILGEVGISLAPLIASAGIASIAIGFGAQSIVRDFLAGIFVVIEDQYGVGDIIDVSCATGEVVEVGFRTTRLRDLEGVLWTIPNGEIQRVGNYSQIWARSVFDISISYDDDIDHASEVIKGVLDDIWLNGAPHATIIDEPEVLGVEELGSSACLLYTSPSPRDATLSRMPSSA